MPNNRIPASPSPPSTRPRPYSGDDPGAPTSIFSKFPWSSFLGSAVNSEGSLQPGGSSSLRGSVVGNTDRPDPAPVSLPPKNINKPNLATSDSDFYIVHSKPVNKSNVDLDVYHYEGSADSLSAPDSRGLRRQSKDPRDNRYVVEIEGVLLNVREGQYGSISLYNPESMVSLFDSSRPSPNHPRLQIVQDQNKVWYLANTPKMNT